ncbi:MAG: hypothetical protein CMF31_07775 [Kordiimonas sp.]|mgnify:CR=1 FL=1|nr:hypothetical protein [Kordiimonas sp.]
MQDSRLFRTSSLTATVMAGLIAALLALSPLAPLTLMAHADANRPDLVPGIEEDSTAPENVILMENYSEDVNCPDSGLFIRLLVTNVKKTVGIITVDVHGDNPDEFLRERVGRARVAAIKGNTPVCVPVEQPGFYAIALYHDKNANKKLDKNWLGIPREPVGLSQNPKLSLSRPKYENSAFEVTKEGADLQITLKNAI